MSQRNANSPLLLEVGEGLSLMLGLPGISSWNTKNRPENAKQGTLGYNSETNSLEYFDGFDWYKANMDKRKS